MMADGPTDMQKMTKILVETERIADQILMKKQESIALDKRRQETREALRTLKNSKDKNSWITVGSMLMKMETQKAIELMAKDQVQIEKEIDSIRKEQKDLVKKHRDLEQDTPLKGFDLKPMSGSEISAIRANLPGF